MRLEENDEEEAVNIAYNQIQTTAQKRCAEDRCSLLVSLCAAHASRLTFGPRNRVQFTEELQFTASGYAHHQRPPSGSERETKTMARNDKSACDTRFYLYWNITHSDVTRSRIPQPVGPTDK